MEDGCIVGPLQRTRQLGSRRVVQSAVLAKNLEVRRIVAGKLKQDWSPQQIAGWLREQYPGNPELWVSHETIYRSLFVQARRLEKAAGRPSPLAEAHPTIAARHGLRSPPR